MPWQESYLQRLSRLGGRAVTERIHIFCKSAKHSDLKLGRQEIETFIRTRARWVPSPPLRARRRTGDWSQGRHPSTERLVDAAQHVYRIEHQRMPKRYSAMQSWPHRAADDPAERLMPVYIECRTGRKVEYTDIPSIDYRWYDLTCRCGVSAKPREERLNQLLNSLAESHQGTVSLEFLKPLC